MVGWVGLAIGAEAAGVAVATSFILLHEKSVLDDDCNAQKQCSPRGFDAAGRIDSLVPLNTVSWIVAAAGLGGGAVLLLTGRGDDRGSTAITVAPVNAGASLSVRSLF